MVHLEPTRTARSIERIFNALSILKIVLGVNTVQQFLVSAHNQSKHRSRMEKSSRDAKRLQGWQRLAPAALVGAFPCRRHREGFNCSLTQVGKAVRAAKLRRPQA